MHYVLVRKELPPSAYRGIELRRRSNDAEKAYRTLQRYGLLTGRFIMHSTDYERLGPFVKIGEKLPKALSSELDAIGFSIRKFKTQSRAMSFWHWGF